MSHVANRLIIVSVIFCPWFDLRHPMIFLSMTHGLIPLLQNSNYAKKKRGLTKKSIGKRRTLLLPKVYMIDFGHKKQITEIPKKVEELLKKLNQKKLIPQKT